MFFATPPRHSWDCSLNKLVFILTRQVLYTQNSRCHNRCQNILYKKRHNFHNTNLSKCYHTHHRYFYNLLYK